MIHEKALESLRKHLKDTLNNCRIDRGCPELSYPQAVHVLKFVKEVVKHTKDWLSIMNVYSIFLKQVHSTLRDKFPNEDNISGDLIKLLDSNEIKKVIDSILAYILSIPREYLIHFPMVGLESLGEGDLPLSEHISIVKYPDKSTIPSGYKGGLLELILGGKQELEPGRLYIRILERGYAGGSADDLAFRRTLSKFKQLLHLGVLYNVFQIREDTPKRWLLGQQPYNAAIIDNANPDVVACSTGLASDIAQLIERVELNTSNKLYILAKKGGEKVVCEWLKGVLKTPLCLIDSTGADNKDALQIKNSIEWAFDSLANDNETIAFLQMCIGIEAILGDDSWQELLTERLADRCAYLLGTNIEKRKEIREKFKKLYRFRSKLVHGRAVRLPDAEKKYLYWGRTTLDSVIRKEINNLNLKI